MVVQRGFQVACCSQNLRDYEPLKIVQEWRPADQLEILPLRSTAERQQIVVLLGSLAVSSKHTGLSFLEGCLRAYSGKNPAVQLLSSGTEDFFLETVYFKSVVTTCNSPTGASSVRSLMALHARQTFQRTCSCWTRHAVCSHLLTPNSKPSLVF